ncbi:MAG TPA: NUDIX domain-containing protein [Gemmatimonadales bacterium]|jgi:8-oxo-dGTP pyrophosphatase MutT (NUDIX family)
MTTIATTFVDVYVLRGREDALEVLLLRRARDRVRAGTWECVHGRIDPGELPAECARRELLEETGCHALALYNLSRVEQFYLHHDDRVALIPVFVAFVTGDAVVQLSDEHDTWLWLSPEQARTQWSWPRAERAIADAVRLLGRGNAGELEDVLRVR